MPHKAEQNIGIKLIRFYIFAIFTYGFWVNFLNFTLIIDLSIIATCLYVFINNKGKLEYNSECKVIVQLCGVFIFGVILVAIARCFSIKMSILGARSYIAYMIMALGVSNIQLTEKENISIMDTIENLGTASAAFGIIQFLFNSYMPDILLHMGSSSIAYVYGLGNLVFRANGLFENTIVYGGILDALLTFIMARIIYEEKKKKHLFDAIIVFSTIILTFSRVAILGTLGIILFEILINSRKAIGSRLIKIVLIIVMILWIVPTYFSNTVFYKNLIGQSSNTQRSNQVHLEAFDTAQEVLEDNWICGVGMGTQGYESTGSTVKVIRDGTWYTFALELGIPLTALYWVILLMILLYIFKRIYEGNASAEQKIYMVSSITAIVFFIISSFMNSSYIARENMALSWLLIAFALHNNDASQNIEEFCTN